MGDGMSYEGALARLGERHIQILDLLDRGAPIKLISAELDISPSRVNQLIRELKDTLHAPSRFGLVQAYRQFKGSPAFCRNDLYPKTALPVEGVPSKEVPGAAVGEFIFSDAARVILPAPWDRLDQPKVVLGMLDGADALSRRLVTMIAMAAFIAAALVLVLVAAVTVTQVWDGIGHVPQSDRRLSDEHRQTGEQ